MGGMSRGLGLIQDRGSVRFWGMSTPGGRRMVASPMPRRAGNGFWWRWRAHRRPD